MQLTLTPGELVADYRRRRAATRRGAGFRFAAQFMLLFLALWFLPQLLRGAFPLYFRAIPAYPALVSLLIFVVSFLTTILVHELGHWLVALAAGFRFVALRAGPVRLHRARHGLRLTTSWSPPHLLSGQTEMIPSGDRALIGRQFLVATGGPLASLGQLALSLTLLWPYRGRVIDFVPGQFLSWLILCALLVLVLSLLPLRHSGAMSDGANMLALARGGPEAQRRAAMAALAAFSAAGQRPREWPERWLSLAVAGPAGGNTLAPAHYAAYFHAADRGDQGRAGQHLDQALRLFADQRHVLLFTLFLEAAYFTARHAGDGDTAREWLELSRGGPTPAHGRILAEAALARAEGDHRAAAHLASRGLALLDKMIETGELAVLRERLEQLTVVPPAPGPDPA